MISNVLFYALCIVALVGLFIAMRRDVGLGVGLVVTTLVVGAALAFAGIMSVPWTGAVAAGITWAYGLTRSVEVLGNKLPATSGQSAVTLEQIPVVDQIPSVGISVQALILAVIGILLLIGLSVALQGNRGARLPVGGALLVFGLLLATYGALNFLETGSERTASNGGQAQRGHALVQRIGDARLQVLGGVGATGIGIVYLAWTLVPPRREER